MKFLVDFFPILLFFIAYKLAGIYIATVVAIGAAFIQVIYTRLRYRKWDKMQVITFLLLVILGSATLFLHDELFIKWKPTVINWLFALFFLGSQLISKKPVIRELMQNQIELSPAIWQRLNTSWIIFFFLTGLANLYVVYHFDTDVWVNFKLFGILGLTVLFVILQAIYLAKHLKHEQS